MFQKAESYARLGIKQAQLGLLLGGGLIAGGLLLKHANNLGKGKFPMLPVATVATVIGLTALVAYAFQKSKRNWSQLENELNILENTSVRDDASRRIAMDYLQNHLDAELAQSAVNAIKNQDLKSWYDVAKSYVTHQVISNGMSLSDYFNELYNKIR